MSTTFAPNPSEVKKRRQIDWVPIITLGVPLLFVIVFFVLPIFLIGRYSFNSIDPLTGLMQTDWSWDSYERALTSTIYQKIFLRTLSIALLSTVVALLIAYPLGYFIGAIAEPRQQGTLILLILIPFWTSYVIRTYAWIGILQSNGFLEQVFGWVPGFEGNLLYTRAAVIVGFVHVYLPIMILPIYASARNLDKRYIEAAHDLGASPVRTFFRVTLPLTSPGVVAGIVLFFIPVFGSFVTPQLLGGTGDIMMGQQIQNQFGEAFNWPFGAALSIVMTAVVLIAMILFFRFSDVEEIYGT